MEKLFMKSGESFVEKISPYIQEAAEAFSKYHGFDEVSDETSRETQQILKAVFMYTKTVSEEYRTTFFMIRHLRRISLTGEIKYLFPDNDYQKETELSCRFKGAVDSAGDSLLMLAGSTLYYYYQRYERYKHSEWYNRRIDQSWDKLKDLPALKTKKKEESSLNEEKLPVLIKQKLDLHFFGQEKAKERLAMSVASLIKVGVRHPMLIIGPSGCGKSYLMQSLAEIEDLNNDIYVHTYNSKDLTENGFSGDDVKDIFKALKSKSKGRKPILFFDEFDKLLVYGSSDLRGNDVYKNVVQSLYSAISGNSSNYDIDTNDVLFVFAGAFENIFKPKQKTPMGFAEKPLSDNIDIRRVLSKHNVDDQFISRLTNIVVMDPLDHDSLKKIFTDKRDGVLSKKQAEFSAWGLQLKWNKAFIDSAINEVMKSDQGARYATTIVEKCIGTYDYEMCASGKRELFLDRDVIYGKKPRII